MGTRDLAAWTEFLDHLDEELTEANRALDEGQPFDAELVETWTAPTNLGVLPLQLLERAESINAALNELQQRAEHGQTLIREELGRLSRLRSNAPAKAEAAGYGEQAIPVYVDRAI